VGMGLMLFTSSPRSSLLVLLWHRGRCDPKAVSSASYFLPQAVGRYKHEISERWLKRKNGLLRDRSNYR
jgi:hypothetical protein